MAAINTLFKNPLNQQSQNFNLASTSFASAVETLHNLSIESTGFKHGKLLFVDKNNAKLMHQLGTFDKYTSVSSPVNSFQLTFPNIDGLEFLGLITYPTIPTICVFHKNLAQWAAEDMVLLHVNMPKVESVSSSDEGKISHAFTSKLTNIPNVPELPPMPEPEPEPEREP